MMRAFETRADASPSDIDLVGCVREIRGVREAGNP